ncbi:MAG: ketopantoate reductase family protein [Desulfobacterales bacterium]|nr:ketopantoate reductase family protein [Desulfobacterales bacterium]
MQKIAVIGAGALGGMYAARISDNDPDSVFLVAGGDRKRRLETEGFYLNDRQYILPVAEPEGPVMPADLIIVGVKYGQLDQAVGDMARFVGSGTQILSVMNGIDSEERIAAAYGWERTLYCVALGMDPLRENNRIRVHREGRLLFGEAENKGPSGRLAPICTLFDRCGIAWEIPDDMIRALWWKYMINIGINQCSAVCGAPFGLFQRFEEARALMDSAMAETIAVARARGIDLTEADIGECHKVMAGLSPEGKTSMLQDLDAVRRTEVDMFAGTLTAMAEDLGVDTPVNRTLLRIIRVLEEKANPG